MTRGLRAFMLLASAAAILTTAPGAFSAPMLPGGAPDEFDGGANPPGSEVPAKRREEIRKKIEAIRIWRLTDELKLDSDTSAKLAALLGSIDRKRRDVNREHLELMRDLRKSLRSEKPDESRIRQLLDKLEKNDRALQDLKYSELDGAKQFLTVEQQARFVIFQLEFQRNMREIIAGARRGQTARRPEMGPGGPGHDFRDGEAP